MFTLRKVFSSSFTISAARVLETGMIRSIAGSYSARATRPQAGVTPPRILGVLRVSNLGLPGSTRSGENARKKSLPAFRPVASSFGRMTSSVVPG